MKAQVVISETGRQHLAMAGISTGWLRAWLLSAGASRVEICGLENDAWRFFQGWQLVYAEEPELMRISLSHERRIRIRQDGLREPYGADGIMLENPSRMAWHYLRHESHWPTLLVPLGDIAYQRHLLLMCFSRGQALQPCHVVSANDGGEPLEAGLRAFIAPERPPQEAFEWNDAGLLPEEQVLLQLRRYGWKIRTVESCTAGLLVHRLCRVPGASEVVDRSWITYSNQAKHQEVGVQQQSIAAEGAVSPRVVREMAEGGADERSVCLAISGIAGPGGGSREKPVGTVWIAASVPGKSTLCRCIHCPGGRSEIQHRAALAAMQLFFEAIAD